MYETRRLGSITILRRWARIPRVSLLEGYFMLHQFGMSVSQGQAFLRCVSLDIKFSSDMAPPEN